MPKLSLDDQHFLWLGFAVLFALMGAWFGWKYPGREECSRARKVWIWADIAWLLAALFTVAKIIAPVEDALRNGDIGSASATADYLKVDLVRATWRAQDRICAQNQAALQPNVLVCDNLRRIERTLMESSFDHVSAAVVERDYLPALALARPGDESISAIGQAARRFREHYSANARVLQNRTRETNFVVPYLNLYIFIMAFGLRFGRSVAELRRNFLACAKGKKEEPASLDAAVEEPANASAGAEVQAEMHGPG